MRRLAVRHVFNPQVRSTSPVGLNLSVFFPSIFRQFCGDEGDRTLNLRLAKPALSQLSYVPGKPTRRLTPHGSPFSARHMGAHGLEPWTSALSGLRSSQLSYAPRCVK